MSISRRVLPVVVLALVAIPGPLALRAAATTTAEQGVLLPQRTQTTPGAQLVSASSTLFLFQGGIDVDERDSNLHYEVVQRSDGQVLRSFDEAPPGIQEQPYRLIGPDLVKVVRSGATQTVEVADAVTGSLVHTIDVSSQNVLHAEVDWTLVSIPADGGGYSLQIDRANGTTTAVTGTFTHLPSWVGGEDTTGYISGPDGSFSVDIPSGALTTLPITAPDVIKFVTSSSLITFHATLDNVGAQTDHFRSLDRTTLQQSWAVDVPTDSHNRGYVALGSGIGEMYAPTTAPSTVNNHPALRPVDLATGTLGTAIVSDVYDWRPVDDDRVVLTLDDTPGGRLAIADGSNLSAWGDLPDVHAPALEVGLSGSTVFASWADQDGVWSTPSDGSGPWSNTDPSPGFASDGTGRTFVLRGDVAMTGTSTNGITVTYHLTWPGGSRDFTLNTHIYSDPVLSHGGQYLQKFSNTSTEVDDTKTGAVVMTAPDTYNSAIDGTVRWTRSAIGVLTGTDLVTNATTQVNLPPACSTAYIVDVRGHWADLNCSAGFTLLDLHNPTHTTPLAMGGGQLGDGYLAQVSTTDSGISYYLTVTAASTGITRTYGPVRGRGQAGYALAVNDDDTVANLVYADTTSQARIIDLSWVNQSPPIAETAGPAIHGTPRVGSTLTATGGAWDPAGADLAYQWLANGVPINAATTASLPLAATYLGKHITVQVTASKPYFTASSDLSSTVTVLDGVITNTRAPTVRGTLKAGRTLTTVPGSWSPIGVACTYQWLRDSRTIAGAHAHTYKLPRSAKGHRFSVRVTATRAGYTTVTKTSPKTARIR